MNVQSNKRFVVIYDPIKGIPTPDGLASVVVEGYINSSKNYTIVTSTSLVVDCFRLAVSDGRIQHDEIVFFHKDIEVTISERGLIESAPVGFCDLHERYIMQLL